MLCSLGWPCKMYSDKTTEANLDMNQSHYSHSWYIVENDEPVLNTNSQAIIRNLCYMHVLIILVIVGLYAG